MHWQEHITEGCFQNSLIFLLNHVNKEIVFSFNFYFKKLFKCTVNIEEMSTLLLLILNCVMLQWSRGQGELWLLMWRIVATPKSQGLGSVSVLTEQLIYRWSYLNIRCKRVASVSVGKLKYVKWICDVIKIITMGKPLAFKEKAQQILTRQKALDYTVKCNGKYHYSLFRIPEKLCHWAKIIRLLKGHISQGKQMKLW